MVKVHLLDNGIKLTGDATVLINGVETPLPLIIEFYESTTNS